MKKQLVQPNQKMDRAVSSERWGPKLRDLGPSSFSCSWKLVSSCVSFAFCAVSSRHTSFSCAKTKKTSLATRKGRREPFMYIYIYISICGDKRRSRTTRQKTGESQLSELSELSACRVPLRQSGRDMWAAFLTRDCTPDFYTSCWQRYVPFLFPRTL